MQKAKLRGGALLAQSFKEKGVDHVFTLAGGFCNPASVSYTHLRAHET